MDDKFLEKIGAMHKWVGFSNEAGLLFELGNEPKRQRVVYNGNNRKITKLKRNQRASLSVPRLVLSD